MKDLIAFGLYHNDHITNKIYRDALKILKVKMYGRISTKQDINSNYEHIQEIKPNILIGPADDPLNKQTKGFLISNILKIDSENFDKDKYPLNTKLNKQFKLILWSSMPMSEDMENYISKYLQTPHLSIHGSTEVGAIDTTCFYNPLSFHIGYGQSLTLIKSLTKKKLATEGETGKILVTKVGSTNEEGENMPCSGSIFIQYVLGDNATITNTKGKRCKCGRNTPIIKIKRVEDKELKAIFGCQAD